MNMDLRDAIQIVALSASIGFHTQTKLKSDALFCLPYLSKTDRETFLMVAGSSNIRRMIKLVIPSLGEIEVIDGHKRHKHTPAGDA
jgi:hypothetical protein